MIVPKCTMLYGITVFDGPKIVDWGNKINASVHEERPDGGPWTLHSERWTIAMNIVTYARPGGAPLDAPPARAPGPREGGNTSPRS